MLKRVLIWAAVLTGLPALSFSYWLDYSGSRYTALQSELTQKNLAGLDGVVVYPPLKGYSGPRMAEASAIYDYQDAGTDFQRGTLSAAAGTLEDFHNLVAWCRSAKIQVIVRVDYFYQLPGYKRSVWSDSDFTLDSLKKQNPLVVDIRQEQARKNLSAAAGELKKLGADAVLIDISHVDESQKQDYADFAQSQLGALALLQADSLKGRFADTATFSDMMRRAFFSGQDTLAGILKQPRDTGRVYCVRSESLAVTETAVVLSLIMGGCQVLLPAAYSSASVSELLETATGMKGAAWTSLDPLSATAVLGKKVIAVNLNDEPAFFSAANLKIFEELTAADRGGAWIGGSGHNGIFLMPGSIAWWNQGQPRKNE